MLFYVMGRLMSKFEAIFNVLIWSSKEQNNKTPPQAKKSIIILCGQTQKKFSKSELWDTITHYQKLKNQILENF